MKEFDPNNFWKYLQASLPRILSQLDRDENSPTFGSFDRNYWHYHIRDFSSMIIQQGMLILETLYKKNLPGNQWYNNPLAKKWVDGSIRFWARQQLKSGAFNEYYPGESGYPPTAFSLYAVGYILKGRSFPEQKEKIQKAIQKACNWLLKHPEKDAYNQEAAGLAGLVLCSNVPGIHIDDQKLENRLSSFYKGQSPEGWFPEYDGPDLGYLSVAIDCLWDIYETSGDERALAAIEKAVVFVSKMITVSGHTPVMINSRNTDYIVPYGMTRFAKQSPLAAKIIKFLFGQIGDSNHFLNRTDDRYACHYVYQSCFRSLPFLDEMVKEVITLPAEEDFYEYLDHAGILIKHLSGEHSIFVNGKKGGIINVFKKTGINDVDFGWRAKLSKGKVAVTHWLNEDYDIVKLSDNQYEIKGNMSAHGWMKTTPVRHMILRMISFFLGNKLVPLLKKAMILGKASLNIKFLRKITLEDKKIIISDSFSGSALEKKKLYRAPHYSLRHVSSAGQFVPEEMITVDDQYYGLNVGENELFTSREIKI